MTIITVNPNTGIQITVFETTGYNCRFGKYTVSAVDTDAEEVIEIRLFGNRRTAIEYSRKFMAE